MSVRHRHHSHSSPALLASLALLLITLLPAIGVAADDEKMPTASRPTYLKLMEVQELWEEERYEEALAVLDELAGKVQGKAAYDYVVVNQYLAHTSILTGRASRARGALETAIDAAAAAELPARVQAELKLFYGQVMLGEEEYEIAREAFDEWLASEPASPKASHLFSAAYAHYRSDSLAWAEALVKDAIDAATTVEDNWERLYYQILFEREKYDEAEALLMRMLARTPRDTDRWQMLSNHYLRLENSERALASMLVTHQQAPFTDPDELRKMISLYGFLEVPERAARMLERYMADGVIETEPETLRQLGNLWMLARERDKAKAVLEQAAAVAPDGRTWELLGSIHFEDEQWAPAYDAFSQALENGGLKEPHRVSLLAGLSAMRAGKKPQAREALQAAAEDEELRPQARGLLKRLDES